MKVARDAWRSRGGLARENATDASKKRKVEWEKRNPFAKTARSCRLRARGVGAIGDVTPLGLEQLFEGYSNLCVYCLSVATEVDHVVPFSRGGSNDISNIVPACESCNSSKQDTPLVVWMARRKTHFQISEGGFQP